MIGTDHKKTHFLGENISGNNLEQNHHVMVDSNIVSLTALSFKSCT
jgi:hypothetical protein